MLQNLFLSFNLLLKSQGTNSFKTYFVMKVKLINCLSDTNITKSSASGHHLSNLLQLLTCFPNGHQISPVTPPKQSGHNIAPDNDKDDTDKTTQLVSCPSPLHMWLSTLPTLGFYLSS